MVGCLEGIDTEVYESNEHRKIWIDGKRSISRDGIDSCASDLSSIGRSIGRKLLASNRSDEKRLGSNGLTRATIRNRFTRCD